MTHYDPSDWMYQDASTGIFWSSSTGTTVDQAAVDAWVAAGELRCATRLESAAAISAEMRKYGIPGPVVSVSDYVAAIDAHADAVARARGYRDGDRLASYVGSTNAAWSAEAHAFVAWRDGVWVHALTLMAAVQGGHVPPPTVDGVIAGLPVITWPE